MKTHRCIVSLLACALPWSSPGCGGSDDDSRTSELTGREFLLDTAEGFTPVANTTVRVSFSESDEEGPSFGFSAGCNSHGGSYRMQDDKLVIADLGSTAIGCGDELHDQDQWLADFFTSSPTLLLEGDELTFTGDDATLIFLDREVVDPDRLLTGQVWLIDTFISMGAASNLALANKPTVEFDQDGSVEVFSGCNTASGSYQADGHELTFSDLAYTEIACGAPMQTEAEVHVQAVLSNGVVSFDIEADRVTLTREDRSLGAGPQP